MLRQFTAGLVATAAFLAPVATRSQEIGNETITIVQKYYFINDSTNQFDTFKTKKIFKKVGSIDGIDAYLNVKIFTENKSIPHMGIKSEADTDAEYIDGPDEFINELIINTNTGHAMLASQASQESSSSSPRTRSELYEKKGEKWIGWKINTDYLNGQAGYTEFYIEK